MDTYCVYVFKKGSRKNEKCISKTFETNCYCKKHLRSIKQNDVYIPPIDINTSDNCLWSPQEVNIPDR